MLLEVLFLSQDLLSNILNAVGDLVHGVDQFIILLFHNVLQVGDSFVESILDVSASFLSGLAVSI